MNEANPYATPKSELLDVRETTYTPRVLAFSGRIGRVRYFAYNTAATVGAYAAILILPIFDSDVITGKEKQ